MLTLYYLNNSSNRNCYCLCGKIDTNNNVYMLHKEQGQKLYIMRTENKLKKICIIVHLLMLTNYLLLLLLWYYFYGSGP